jgi:hypothetical protein
VPLYSGTVDVIKSASACEVTARDYATHPATAKSAVVRSRCFRISHPPRVTCKLHFHVASQQAFTSHRSMVLGASSAGFGRGASDRLETTMRLRLSALGLTCRIHANMEEPC